MSLFCFFFVLLLSLRILSSSLGINEASTLTVDGGSWILVEEERHIISSLVLLSRREVASSLFIDRLESRAREKEEEGINFLFFSPFFFSFPWFSFFALAAFPCRRSFPFFWFFIFLFFIYFFFFIFSIYFSFQSSW